MADSDFCWAHDPTNAEAAAEARRLGGMRHRREGTVAGAYQLEGLNTVQDIRRLIEIAVIDTIGMANSLQRSRTLAYLAQTALKSLEVGEVQDRLQVLEQLVLGRRVFPVPIFMTTMNWRLGDQCGLAAANQHRALAGSPGADAPLAG